MVGLSSDIGVDLARRYLSNGDRLVGTFRNESAYVQKLQAMGALTSQQDLSRGGHLPSDILEDLAEHPWEISFLNPGTMLPVGPFERCSWEEWERSIRVNALSLLQVLHDILPFRKKSSTPLVVAWGGPGTNGAAAGFSAISSSKIFLIKAFEILAEEISDTRFVVVGPGWVETKIHDELLQNGDLASEAYAETERRIESGRFTSPSKIWGFVEWAWGAPNQTLSGRNFSIPGDDWRSDELSAHLTKYPDAFKLRRYHNGGVRSSLDENFSPPEY